MGGNVGKASSTSDLQPLLIAARASVNLASVDGLRSLSMDATFYTSDQQTVLKPNEVMVSVVIPFTTQVYVCMGRLTSEHKK